jgi:glucokinase
VPQKVVIALDLGGTRIKLGLVRGADILVSDQVDAQADQGLQKRLPDLTARINALLQHASLSAADLVGVGIAVPGIVDTVNRKVLTINAKYNDAPQADLVAWAENTWGLSLRMENDTRAAMIGEWRFGQGRGYDNLVLMMLGTGVGTSAVVEGRLLRGKHFQAGILGGHVILNRQGSTCNCGMVGCAEAEASTWTLQNLVTNHSLYPQSILSRVSQLDFKTIFQCASEGDKLALFVREECLDVWAACAYNLMQAYDPEVVILGGGVMASREFILPRVQQKLDQNSWAAWGKVAVVEAALADSAALLGISDLVYNS